MQTPPLLTNFVVRPFDRNEWRLFREMRLHALASETTKFGCKLSVEENYTDSDWRHWIQSSDTRVFGIFAEQRLVAITSAIKWTKDLFEIEEAARWNDAAEDKSVFCGASYILPDYRGQGLSYYLNGATLNWAADQPLYKRALCACRASNRVAEKSILALGFIPIDSKPFDWPDGRREDVVTYRMDLTDWRENRQSIVNSHRADIHVNAPAANAA